MQVIVSRCVLEKNCTIEILQWPENDDDKKPDGEVCMYATGYFESCGLTDVVPDCSLFVTTV